MNKETENQDGRGMRYLRRLFFFFALITLLGSILYYFWPLNRDTLIRIRGTNGKYGFINPQGRMVIEPEWDFVRLHDSEGMAAVLSEGKCGWIDRHGDVVIDFTSPKSGKACSKSVN